MTSPRSMKEVIGMAQEENSRSPDLESGGRIPPGQKMTKKFPVLHAGRVPEIEISKWTFAVGGLVEPKKVLDFEQFMSLEQVKIVSDIHCVTGWSNEGTVVPPDRTGGRTWRGVVDKIRTPCMAPPPESEAVFTMCVR